MNQLQAVAPCDADAIAVAADPDSPFPPSTTESGKKPRADFNQAAVRIVEEAAEKH